MQNSDLKEIIGKLHFRKPQQNIFSYHFGFSQGVCLRILTCCMCLCQQVVARPSSMNYMVAPITGGDIGIRRAEIKQGIREVILCKDQDGKIGLRLKSIDNGIFVHLVQANSPSSLVGLRFGDQVLQINGENCAGWSSDRAHKVLKQAFGEKITMTIRDR